jgi:hypothetical protein
VLAFDVDEPVGCNLGSVLDTFKTRVLGGEVKLTEEGKARIQQIDGGSKAPTFTPISGKTSRPRPPMLRSPGGGRGGRRAWPALGSPAASGGPAKEAGPGSAVYRGV